MSGNLVWWFLLGSAKALLLSALVVISYLCLFRADLRSIGVVGSS